jgi:hypothetical protein
MTGRAVAVAASFALLLATSVSCRPEAARVRGGGAGADVGNHGSPVDTRGRTDPNHDTPLVGRAIAR